MRGFLRGLLEGDEMCTSCYHTGSWTHFLSGVEWKSVNLYDKGTSL